MTGNNTTKEWLIKVYKFNGDNDLIVDNGYRSSSFDVSVLLNDSFASCLSFWAVPQIPAQSEPIEEVGFT
jgi:hypothetical protein